LTFNVLPHRLEVLAGGEIDETVRWRWSYQKFG
jgi:hypothetical protein